MQKFSDLVHANLWLKKRRVRKICAFQQISHRISEMVRDRARVAINHCYVALAFLALLDDTKIINIG